MSAYFASYEMQIYTYIYFLLTSILDFNNFCFWHRIRRQRDWSNVDIAAEQKSSCIMFNCANRQIDKHAIYDRLLKIAFEHCPFSVKEHGEGIWLIGGSPSGEPIACNITIIILC